MPDMAVNIDLPFAQPVMIRYSIQVYTPSAGWMTTRLIIDGVEDDNYRLMTGYIPTTTLTSYWTSLGCQKVDIK